MSDDFEPAVTETATNEDGAESTITTRAPAERVQPVLVDGEKGDNPEAPPGREPRGQRVISDSVRAKIRAMAEAGAKAEAAGDPVVVVGDDLEPMGTEAAEVAPAAVAAAPAVAAPTAPAAPLPIPLIPLPMAPAPTGPDPAVAQAKALQDERERTFAEKEKQFAEREKLLPDLAALIDKPGSTLINWLKSVYGVTDPEEAKTLIADITAELSETALDAKLPPDYKAGLDSRKAMRAMRAMRSDVGKREAALAEQRIATEKAAADAKAAAETHAHEQNALAQVAQLIAPAKATYPYLHDPDITGGLAANVIVWDVIKAQDEAANKWKRENPGYQLPDTMKPNLETATKAANEFYRQKAEADLKKAEALKSKPYLVPPTKAPAAKVASTGAAPGPAAKPASLPVARVEEENADDRDYPMDRRDRRAASAKALFAKHFKKQA
jgi:hypothetical protein